MGTSWCDVQENELTFEKIYAKRFEFRLPWQQPMVKYDCDNPYYDPEARLTDRFDYDDKTSKYYCLVCGGNQFYHSEIWRYINHHNTKRHKMNLAKYKRTNK